MQGLGPDCLISLQEAERDSPKKWTPVIEMQYRGGVYRGRCQGGLPEGKVFGTPFLEHSCSVVSERVKCQILHAGSFDPC